MKRAKKFAVGGPTLQQPQVPFRPPTTGGPILQQPQVPIRPPVGGGPTSPSPRMTPSDRARAMAVQNMPRQQAIEAQLRKDGKLGPQYVDPNAAAKQAKLKAMQDYTFNPDGSVKPIGQRSAPPAGWNRDPKMAAQQNFGNPDALDSPETLGRYPADFSTPQQYKKGGSVRGCGLARKGHGKGTMR